MELCEEFMQSDSSPSALPCATVNVASNDWSSISFGVTRSDMSQYTKEKKEHELTLMSAPQNKPESWPRKFGQVEKFSFA